MAKPIFTSKLLLFGEYGILKGFDALAIPFPKYTGKLEIRNEGTDRWLPGLLEYIKTVRHKLNSKFDLIKLEHEIKSGLKFISNIPFNAGLGSSGALIAALFHRYSAGTRKYLEIELKLLNHDLGILESYFHKKSSGIDPLVSFLNVPVLFTKGEGPKLLDKNILNYPNGYKFFLINSNSLGNTADLVTLLKGYLENSIFLSRFREAYQHSNNAISYMLSGDKKGLFDSFRGISEFQFKNMKQYIPSNVRELFKTGLEHGHFYIKLCGSGGGGHYLGITGNVEHIKKYLDSCIEIIDI